MRSSWLLILMPLFAVSCGTGSKSEPGGEVSELSASGFIEFEAELRAIAEQDGLHGLALAVVDSTGVLWSQGIGYTDLDESNPATADTLFHIGSTHKALNALFVATLVDDEYLDWNTPLADLIPDVDIDPLITIRHLLTMTAGIPADAEDDLEEGRLQQNELASVAFESIADADLLAEAGQLFEYSNISASAAGYASASAAGHEGENLHALYLDLFTERVLEPLGMDDSTLFVSEAIDSGAYSAGFTAEAGLAVVDSLDSDADLLAPSGSLKSTANDMALFLQALLNDGVTASGDVIVSADSIEMMWQPVLENYAMGWEVSKSQGISYLSHEGSYDGYLSIIMLVPDHDLGLVVLTNSEDAGEGLVAAAPELFLSVVSSE